MSEKFKTRILFYIFITLFSVYTGFRLNTVVRPEMRLTPVINMNQAKEAARLFLQTQGFDYTSYGEYAWYTFDNNGGNALIRSLGSEKFSAFTDTTSVPLSSWWVAYYKNVPHDKEEEIFYVFIDRKGNPAGFFHQLPDSVGFPVNSGASRSIAEQYLQHWPGVRAEAFRMTRNSKIQHPHRIDEEFIFERPLAGTTGTDRILITVSGNRVSRFQRYFAEPTQSNIAFVGGANLLFNTLSIGLYLALTILILVLFLRRYHAGEISVRHGLWIGTILYITLILSVFNRWDLWGNGTNLGIISRYYTKWILLGIQMAISYVYIFLNSFTAWSAGDYDMGSERHRWMSGMDSLIARKFFTRNVGRELPLGLAWGAIVFGGASSVLFLLQRLGIASPLMPTTVESYNTYWPFISFLTTGIYTMLFLEVVYRKFLISYLYRLYERPFAAVLISAGVFAVNSIFFNSLFNLAPTYLALLPYFFIGLVQGWLFWRHGLLAAMASGFSYIFLMEGNYLYNAGNDFYTGQLFIGISILVILAVMGLYALWRGKEFHYTEQKEPEHIRRIKERTRMQKELEIAHRVQLGLLPQKLPEVTGFQLAGYCKPALEVGGDYFDFIRLQDNRLGITVADVSGKGVPAAIYMTLTKGILQSHAESDTSPRNVLSKVNNLMYRTMEQSWFVTMFYAVLDTDTKRMLFARAGHNPAILLEKNSPEPRLLISAGIGLGLEEGQIFEKTLVEESLQLHSGQTLVFYTDGFTEAMNAQQEEYGEDRFIRFLNSRHRLDADDLIHSAIEDIERFRGGTEQQDDMTMVVLKVL